MDIGMLICSQDDKLRLVLGKIDQAAKGMVFVVDAAGRFVGIITDGDIRRSLLADCTLDTPAKELLDHRSDAFQRVLKLISNPEVAEKLKKPPVTAPAGTPVEQLMRLVDERVKIIPLLDPDGRLVDFFEYKASFHAPIASSTLDGNELKYLVECAKTNWISSQGRFVKEFERMVAQFCGARHAVAVCNGTAALHLALLALGVGEGDEVIVPDLTFAATASAVVHARATPVLVDVEPDSWCLDPAKVRAAVTSRTAAIIPVHLYGQPAAMDALLDVAAEHGLAVVEDAAEAFGAEFKGRRVGSFGKVGCFSFFGNKIITSGEGGMCVTDDDALCQKMRTLRDHGMSSERKYWHEMVGYNYRMTNLQAAVGVAQMERADSILARRDWIKEFYRDNLEGIPGLSAQPALPGRRAVNWLVSYLLPAGADRDALVAAAAKEGVDLRPFFHPLSQMPPYQGFARQAMPVTADLSARGLSLPTSLSFDEGKYRGIVKILSGIFERGWR